ncbi:MAG: archaetidylserine synthase [Methanosarcinaceae archaeon]|nr:archaetidylserine synthase [Methanosarcinaceae archaeon]
MNFLHTLKVPDIVTLSNALFGLISIFIAHIGYPDMAFVLILMAAVADGVDGYLARIYSGSEIGEFLDSLADVISFGVAPAVVVFIACGSSMPFLVGAVVCIYLVCGILRLARFSIKQKSIPDFEGLPITAAAVVISSYMLIDEKYIYTYVVLAILVLLAYLMVSEHPYPKLRGPRAMGLISLIFILTIGSYFLVEQYTHIFSTILFLLMMLYLESPIMKVPRRYYED